MSEEEPVSVEQPSPAAPQDRLPAPCRAPPSRPRDPSPAARRRRRQGSTGRGAGGAGGGSGADRGPSGRPGGGRCPDRGARRPSVLAAVALARRFTRSDGTSDGRAARSFSRPRDKSGPDPFTESTAKDSSAPPVTTPPPRSRNSRRERRTARGRRRGRPVRRHPQRRRLRRREADPGRCGRPLRRTGRSPRSSASSPTGVPGYLRSLTPVQLRMDTRVTNHGYRDGAATSYQAVLQTGTAVLVDDRGGRGCAVPAATRSPTRYDGTAPRAQRGDASAVVPQPPTWLSWRPRRRSSTIFVAYDPDRRDWFHRNHGDYGQARPEDRPAGRLAVAVGEFVDTLGSVLDALGRVLRTLGSVPETLGHVLCTLVGILKTSAESSAPTSASARPAAAAVTAAVCVLALRRLRDIAPPASPATPCPPSVDRPLPAPVDGHRPFLLAPASAPFTPSTRRRPFRHDIPAGRHRAVLLRSPGGEGHLPKGGLRRAARVRAVVRPGSAGPAPREKRMIDHLGGAVTPTGFDKPVEPLRRATHFTGEPGCIAEARVFAEIFLEQLRKDSVRPGRHACRRRTCVGGQRVGHQRGPAQPRPLCPRTGGHGHLGDRLRVRQQRHAAPALPQGPGTRSAGTAWKSSTHSPPR